MSAQTATRTIRSTIPARLDRLSWSPFHTRMVCGLGAAWILEQLVGAFGPMFYGALIGDGASTTGLFVGYVIGGGIMIAGGIIEIVFGINAEGKSLEDITKPLTATETPAAAAAAPATP
jgi:hypothetical protein